MLEGRHSKLMCAHGHPLPNLAATSPVQFTPALHLHVYAKTVREHHQAAAVQQHPPLLSGGKDDVIKVQGNTVMLLLLLEIKVLTCVPRTLWFHIRRA